MKTPIRFPISTDKEYSTLDGRVITIYSTKAGGSYPIHGAILDKTDNVWDLQKWKKDGTAFFDGSNSIAFEEWEPQDKEFVWCWDDDMIFRRETGFYDKIHGCTFKPETGGRDGYIFRYYAPYECEWPAWAKEAQKKLED